MRGYRELRAHRPDALAAIERQLIRYDAELAATGLAPEHLLASRLTVRRVAMNAARAVATLVLLAPPAVVGIALHWPGYRLIGPLVMRTARPERDVVATAKMLAAGAVFPLTWLIAGALAWHWWGLAAGVATICIAPCCGYAALRFLEQGDRLVGSARGLALRLLRPRAFQRLEAQRTKIRAAIEAEA